MIHTHDTVNFPALRVAFFSLVNVIEQNAIYRYFTAIFQWALADLACQMFSMISVPLYGTHGPKECVYIINHGKKA